MPRLRDRVIALRKFYSVTTFNLFSFLPLGAFAPFFWLLGLLPRLGSSPPREFGTVLTVAHPAQGPAPANRFHTSFCSTPRPWLPRREVPREPQRGWPRLALAAARPRFLSPPPSIPLVDAQYSLCLACASYACPVVFCPGSELPQEKGVRWLRHLASFTSMQETQSRFSRDCISPAPY